MLFRSGLLDRYNIFSLLLIVLPFDVLAHGYGDLAVFAFFGGLLFGVICIQAIGIVVCLSRGKFSSKGWLQISLSLSVISAVLWLFVVMAVVGSRSADAPAYILLAAIFLVMVFFVLAPLRQYERSSSTGQVSET